MRLKHWLAVGRILGAGVVIVIGVVLFLRGLLNRRRLLIVLLRCLVCWLLLIILLRRLICWLGPVRGGKVGRIGGILRLIGLRRLTLGSIVLTVFVASRESERQRDGCGCKNDKKRYFARHIPPDGDAERTTPPDYSLIPGSFGSVQKRTLPRNLPFENL